MFLFITPNFTDKLTAKPAGNIAASNIKQKFKTGLKQKFYLL